MDLPSLTRPEHLAWLALLPVLYWLSRPHRPRKSIGTPHLAQWLRARARLRRRPVRFRWWRFLLLALAFTSSVLALCGPSGGGREGPRSLAVLVDVSGSLAARGESGTAWTEARAHLERKLSALPAAVQVRIALCGDGVRGLEGAAAEILAALPAAPRGAGTVDLDALAAQLQSHAGEVAVWTVTDGLGPTAPPRHGSLSVVGAARSNVGFTSWEVEDHWPLPEVSLVVELSSFDDESRELRLAVEGGVEAWPARSVRLGPGATQRLELPLRRTAGGTLRVYLDGHEDALALDDQLVVELPVPPPADIAVLGDDEPSWIATAASALAKETGGRVVRGTDAETAGLLLVDGGIFPQPAGSMRFVTFGTRASDQPLAVEDIVARPRVVDWDRSDPITRGLDLSELSVASCLRRDFIGSGKVLVRAEHGPLIVVDEGENWTSVHAAFRLGDSNLPLLTAFPQLLRRCFARSFRTLAQPRPSADNLLSAAESDLRRGAPAAAYENRPLPEFGRPGTSLVVPLLVLAMGALALRVYA